MIRNHLILSQPYSKEITYESAFSFPSLAFKNLAPYFISKDRQNISLSPFLPFFSELWLAKLTISHLSTYEDGWQCILMILRCEVHASLTFVFVVVIQSLFFLFYCTDIEQNSLQQISMAGSCRLSIGCHIWQ